MILVKQNSRFILFFCQRQQYLSKVQGQKQYCFHSLFLDRLSEVKLCKKTAKQQLLPFFFSFHDLNKNAAYEQEK